MFVVHVLHLTVNVSDTLLVILSTVFTVNLDFTLGLANDPSDQMFELCLLSDFGKLHSKQI